MNKTPLHPAHAALNAKMGPFAGYDMPLYYADGVLKEHEWVRAHAGLFDVSHMGQVVLTGEGVAAFWEHVTPSAFSKTKNGVAKYTVLLNEAGGILDDLIVTRLEENKFYTVINAGRKHDDLAWLRAHLLAGLTLDYLEAQALMALQGPAAQAVMYDVFGLDLTAQAYMSVQSVDLHGVTAFVSRLGYTGEDGFEISVPGKDAVKIWNELLAHAEVKPIGLAARDSLRLEMGYCLYGHDIDETTTPLEADLGWVVRKTDLNCVGAEKISAQREAGAARKRVGIRLTDKGVAREGAAILDLQGHIVGTLTSGGHSPTLKESIGQGYVPVALAQDGQQVLIDVRGRHIPAVVCKMPFIAAKTKAAQK